MKPVTHLLVGFVWLILSASLCHANQMPLADTIGVAANGQPEKSAPQQQDIADYAKRLFPRWHLAAHDSSTLHEGRRFVLVIPQVGYTLQTRALVAVLVNTPFRRPRANMSSMTGMISYTQNNQVILTATSSVWSHDNEFLFMNDWRLMHYPQATYGLGMYTSTDTRVVNMDYAYFRFYQSILRRLAPNLYGGVGYYLDLHWNIDSYNSVREFTRISRYAQWGSGAFGVFRANRSFDL